MKYLCALLFLPFIVGKGGHDSETQHLVYVHGDTNIHSFKSYLILDKIKRGYKVTLTDSLKEKLYSETIVGFGQCSSGQIVFTVDKGSEIHYSNHPYTLDDLVRKDSVKTVVTYMTDYWGEVYEDSLTLKSANISAGKPSRHLGIYHLLK